MSLLEQFPGRLGLRAVGNGDPPACSDSGLLGTACAHHRLPQAGEKATAGVGELLSSASMVLHAGVSDAGAIFGERVVDGDWVGLRVDDQRLAVGDLPA